MFSGIIEETSTIEKVLSESSDNVLIAIKPNFLPECILGQSIAVQGICLTITEINEMVFFFLSKETLDCSNAQYWQLGQEVNLERSLKFGDRVDGHLVSGHVDGLIKVVSIDRIGDAQKVTFRLSQISDSHLIYTKGSIAIDGISLTINDISHDCFTVMIIPHTWRHTNAKHWEIGQDVHVEFDSMAKIINNQLKARDLL